MIKLRLYIFSAVIESVIGNAAYTLMFINKVQRMDSVTILHHLFVWTNSMNINWAGGFYY